MPRNVQNELHAQTQSQANHYDFDSSARTTPVATESETDGCEESGSDSEEKDSGVFYTFEYLNVFHSVLLRNESFS